MSEPYNEPRSAARGEKAALPYAMTVECDRRDDAARPRRPLELSTPQSFVHCMLFMVEYVASTDPRREKVRRHLNLFFSRFGGMHLLLMLLNAYYNKPLAGRDPGWVFRGIRERIQISERALRMLINDAVAEGLIIQEAGKRDRRCRKYRLSPSVVESWESLTGTLRSSLADVFTHFDADALANVDYRRWDPELPARDQKDTVPPSHRHLSQFAR